MQQDVSFRYTEKRPGTVVCMIIMIICTTALILMFLFVDVDHPSWDVDEIPWEVSTGLLALVAVGIITSYWMRSFTIEIRGGRMNLRYGAGPVISTCRIKNIDRIDLVRCPWYWGIFPELKSIIYRA